MEYMDYIDYKLDKYLSKINSIHIHDNMSEHEISRLELYLNKFYYYEQLGGGPGDNTSSQRRRRRSRQQITANLPPHVQARLQRRQQGQPRQGRQPQPGELSGRQLRRLQRQQQGQLQAPGQQPSPRQQRLQIQQQAQAPGQQLSRRQQQRLQRQLQASAQTPGQQAPGRRGRGREAASGQGAIGQQAPGQPQTPGQQGQQRQPQTPGQQGQQRPQGAPASGQQGAPAQGAATPTATPAPGAATSDTQAPATSNATTASRLDPSSRLQNAAAKFLESEAGQRLAAVGATVGANLAERYANQLQQGNFQGLEGPTSLGIQQFTLSSELKKIICSSDNSIVSSICQQINTGNITNIDFKPICSYKQQLVTQIPPNTPYIKKHDLIGELNTLCPI